MAEFMVNITSIQGEGTTTGYADQIACSAMRQAIDLPVVSRGTQRTEGASRHGSIELTHSVDKASPGLRHAASAGKNLGEVIISRLRTIAGAPALAEKITLGNAYVVRVDLDTEVLDGQPWDEPTERFQLEYSDITWEHNHYVNGVKNSTVSGAWSTATQSVNF